MRILLLHNYYQQEGGEDTVVANECELLVSHKNDVKLFSVSNYEIKDFFKKLKTAWKSPYSTEAKFKIATEIAHYQPDVVHMHNFFPILTPSIYDSCRESNVPVVQTLHNFRTICPNALLMREGKLCEKCVKSTPYHSVIHGCYRNSRIGTLALAHMVNYHRSRNTWATKVDRFIALTNFAKNKFIEAGFPEHKITVKPNFYKEKVKGLAKSPSPRNGALFVGRLSPEKGVPTLLRAWHGLAIPLRIAGAGPLLSMVQASDNLLVTYTGRLDADVVSIEMGKAAFLVMPSEWYEGFPMVLVEAFAHGLPVIASRLGSLAEIVEDGMTGLHFKPGNAENLAAKVRWAVEHPEEMQRMGENARREYELKYTGDVNYRQLMEIYEGVVEEKREGGRHA